ncbi:hypothetical protein Hanom_Chr14g01308791 [Helianthus anomalus]
MILLIGMKISLTKNPTNPITTKPMAVRTATFENSENNHIRIQINNNRSRSGIELN